MTKPAHPVHAYSDDASDVAALEPAAEPVPPPTDAWNDGTTAAPHENERDPLPRHNTTESRTLNPSHVQRTLHNTFGFSQFRPNQESIIQAILERKDTLAVMPTGSGKSLCYQLPACLLPGTCVIVSPLISLMKDQVDAAGANGLRAACCNSSQKASERNRVLRGLEAGDLDMVYVSPERLSMDAFFTGLKRCDISFFAIDEAHCISEWGHDFRPDYLCLGDVVSNFPDVPIAAFTATATWDVQTDIVARLRLRSPHIVRASFDRPNLFYEAIPKENVGAQILEFVRARPDEAGIVYRATRKAVEDTAAMLVRAGIRALPYHAGLENNVRNNHQEMFNRDRVQVVVATIAFGMGIDKSNIRFVIHGDLPKNLESYYQETGRAGRDGEPAQCTLFYAGQDTLKIRYFIDRMQNEDERKRCLDKLYDMVTFASVNACRRHQLLAYFGETLDSGNCGHCDVCCGHVERVDATRDARIVMSAIARTEERFGAGMIADIVRGADTNRIRQWGLNQLRTYGKGEHEPKKYWRHLIDELVAQQCLRRGNDRYPTLSLTARGRNVLFGKVPFHATKTIEQKKKDTQKHLDRPGNTELFERLRQLRRELAEQQDVPPFVIFSDRSLREMTQLFPTSEREMRAVTGVGDTKWRAYGEAFSNVISDFLEAHPDVTPPGPVNIATPDQSADCADQPLSETYEHTWHLLQNGLTPAEIADRRDLTESTVTGHIERLMEVGRAIDITTFVSANKRAHLKALFQQTESELLAPVVKASGDTVTYAEARLVRAWLRTRERENDGQQD
ncbi:MAG: DNA helicase RecQ [Candidatus Pacebacteria bacterium]|nr:DNA helicase RecQ [Candidatus Paceibacterota bacterium]